MSSLIALLWFSLLTGCLAMASRNPESEFDLSVRDPDLNTPKLIAKYGYRVESHTVRTEDGYILTLRRIPYGRKSSSRTNRSPVLVQHSMRSSSEDRVVMGPEKGLATASSNPESELDLRARDPDTDLTTPELIAKYGYPVESHTVRTEDGYLLTLHRIPYGRKSSSRTNRPPVLVQHGLLSSSADWIVMGPEKSLGYILADAGYDVWLGNARGNTWSKKHVTLKPSQSKFWQFSWHEMGVYDLPAVIDYILERTGEEKLFYIGHSMGTTMFYVMASEKPEYNSKIRAMFALAPVAYMSHAGSPFLKALAFAGDQIGWFAKLMGMNEFLPHTELLTIMGQLLCKDEAITQAICDNVVFLIGGYNSKELNSTMIPVILGHTPAGASTRNFVHYAQSIKTKKFRQFNHGWLKNLAVYGSATPPTYDTSKITAPIALMYGMNDALGAPGDVATLNQELPNVISYYKVGDEQFGHLDFLWAIHVKSLLYDEILRLMAKY